MRAYELQVGKTDVEGLVQVEREDPRPGPGQVVVRMRAASLNARDLLVARDSTRTRAVIPLSDGAGEVVEVGASVSNVQVGDRVLSVFSPDWRNGPFEARYRNTVLGGAVDGVLAQQVVLRADAVVHVPASLAFEQAATLPCAGCTAWNALFEASRLRPGETVLVQGTGGVSIFALQLARAAGARVIVTSSSDHKLSHVLKLGAEHGVNYRTTPEWGREISRLTNQEGVTNVIEVGGAATLGQSIEAARVGGTISLIGILSGSRGEVDVAAIYRKGLNLRSVDFGSRAMLTSLLDAVIANRIEPVIDRVFDFDDAPDAYRRLASGAHLGKVIVRI